MGKIQPGTTAIHTRNPVPPETTDREPPPPQALIASAMARLAGMLSDLRRIAEDRSRPVDEYVPQTLVPDAVTSLFVNPQFDSMPERIESIVITGPAGAVNVQLGDRDWALTIPAEGVLVIAPVSMLLNRNDVRQLTSATGGAYSLELMGWADERY